MLIAQWFVTQSKTDVPLNKPKDHPEGKRKSKLVSAASFFWQALTRLQELYATASACLTLLFWSFLHTTRNSRSSDQAFNQFKEESQDVAGCSNQQHHKHAFPHLCWSNQPASGRKLPVLLSGHCTDHVSAFPLYTSKIHYVFDSKKCSGTFSPHHNTLQRSAKSHITKQPLLCGKKSHYQQH